MRRSLTAAIAAVVSAASLTMATAPSVTAAIPTPRPVAVIGDYGSGDANERRVADHVKSINPVAVVTVGDNVYDSSDYQRLVNPYYGTWIAQKRFWPAVGNHDLAEGIEKFDANFPYLDGRHEYTFGAGGMRFFVIDSTTAVHSASSRRAQSAWLKQQLQASSARWKVVVMHDAPYSSGRAHGSTQLMRWPFKQWGADLVLSGHEHNYERLVEDGLTYVVDGSGGKDLYKLGNPIPGSLVRNDVDYGALTLRATPTQLTGEFTTAAGKVVDRWSIAQG